MEPNDVDVVLALIGTAVKIIDPLGLASILKNRGVINKKVYTEYIQSFVNCQERSEICHYLFGKLIPHCPLTTFFNALQVLGYKYECELLFDAVARQKGKRDIPRIYRRNTRHEVDVFYHNLRDLLYNSSFRNPEECLPSLGERMLSKLYREACVPRRQLLADKCIVLLAIEIDTIIASGSRSATEILQSTKTQCENMRMLIPVSSNSIAADVVCNSRLASIQATYGNVQEGQRMMMKAQVATDNIVACFQLVKFYYNQLVMALDKSWSIQSIYAPRTLVQIGHFGLTCLQNEEDDTRIMWQRKFLILMTFSLLSITSKGDVNTDYKPDNVDLQEVSGMLASIDQCWEGIGIREEMLYCVARARVTEITAYMTMHRRYTERALKLAILGSLKDERNAIRAYIEYAQTGLGVLANHPQATHVHSSYKLPIGVTTPYLPMVQHDSMSHTFPTQGDSDKATGSMSESIVDLQRTRVYIQPYQSTNGQANSVVAADLEDVSKHYEFESEIVLSSAVTLTLNSFASGATDRSEETLLKKVVEEEERTSEPSTPSNSPDTVKQPIGQEIGLQSEPMISNENIESLINGNLQLSSDMHGTANGQGTCRVSEVSTQTGESLYSAKHEDLMAFCLSKMNNNLEPITN